MRSFAQAVAVAAVTFGASLVGMALQWVVPADVLTASKGTVGAMVGLVTLLLALVLGLLVFTAFSVFTTQRDEAYSLGPLVAEVDLALEHYGPEAAGGRAGLRAALRALAGPLLRRREARAAALHLRGDAGDLPRPGSYFDRPEARDRRPARARLRRRGIWSRKFADTQMLMARQLASPFPPYVLTVVVCWASALFLGNGLVATPNAVSVLAHLAGAIAIGSAIFLILELSSPYTGVIRLSSAGIDRVLADSRRRRQEESGRRIGRRA